MLIQHTCVTERPLTKQNRPWNAQVRRPYRVRGWVGGKLTCSYKRQRKVGVESLNTENQPKEEG